MDTIKNAGNYVSDKVQSATSGASKEANKNVAKDNNAGVGTRIQAAVALLLTALAVSRRVLDPHTTPTRLRVLFIWHAFDALIHFLLEGSFVYHCLFSSAPVSKLAGGQYLPDPGNYLNAGVGGERVVHGAQAGGENPFAVLWMVYARADWRWSGVDLTVLSLEILTVVFGGCMACLVCYDIARKSPRANLGMVILATAELYGGYMTFMPEWLTGSVNLDTSNFMYKWIFLVFFNGLWVVVPLYAIYVAADDMFDAFKVRATALGEKKAR
ncbi:Emopamil-binding protein [Parathielavia appendiculata]|uniref:Emopamil-binding protein n=1 Tax=Parathielavia appendiculata TaxID=2587402 RepID=A0AAN6U7D5_9PEZI|nr:Emopamil-binding protein [Parathielavia appendiculata]